MKFHNRILSKVRKSNHTVHKKGGMDIAFSIVIFTILAAFTIVLLGIFSWGVMTSFKTDFDFLFNKAGWPEEWTFDNFIGAVKGLAYPVDMGTRTVSIWMMYLNSILYAVGGGLCMAIMPCIVAYLTVKFPCKFSNAITAFVIVAMIIPIVGSAPSELQMAQKLGLYDRIWGQWIMKSHFLGMYFLVYQGAFKGIPKSINEAAEIDGAGNMQIFLQIMIPLVKTTFFLVFLLQFIGLWNDYQTPLLYLPNHPTIAQGLYYFNFSLSNEYATVPAKIAGAMFVLLPILIVFLALRDKLMGNLTLGGDKE